MMKRVLLILAVAVSSIATAVAAEKDAVYCWVNGSSTCYRLSDEPVITYAGGAAVLTIDGVEQLRLPMADISQLTITYGEYQNITMDEEQLNGSSNVQPVEKVGKYIRGGRLIIVKDGKMYDAQGREVEIFR